MELLSLVAGVMIGVAFGVLVVSITAVGSYDRGYDAAVQRRPFHA